MQEKYGLKTCLYFRHRKWANEMCSRKRVMFPPGIEPGTFRVLGGCDNHYTTETDGRKMAKMPIKMALSLIRFDQSKDLRGQSLSRN